MSTCPTSGSFAPWAACEKKEGTRLEIRREAGLDAGQTADQRELEQVNRLSRRPLTAEEVYLFTVRLCDNEVDRDFERFSRGELETLAEKFLGKSGVFDHQWSARGQTARIYRTEVAAEPGMATRAGEPYCYLKGWAYMLRTPGNQELIAEIEGGIKREVSVGCAVERVACSLCGHDLGSQECGHVKGRTYGGRLCWGELTGVTDAYEWSFVAVPAQPRAGVLHKGAGAAPELRKALAGQEGNLLTLEELEREAGLGRRYLAELRREVARLGGLAGAGLDAGTLKGILEKLDEEELLALKEGYARQARERFPAGVQLTYRGEGEQAPQQDGAFLI